MNGGRFALKELRQERVTPERIARFKDEFRVLERMSHPNLAKVHELIADRAGVYLLMELVEGVDFIRFVRPGAEPACVSAPSTEGESERSFVEPLSEGPGGGTLNLERLRDAAAQLTDGLRALHGSGSVHCDVKPENVLVTHEGRVVIVDFGLVTEAVHARHWRGTPAFMAPEQFEGAYTEATDWYAVGMLLYGALCDRFPVAVSPSTIALTRHLGRPVDPRLHTTGLPDDLVELSLALLDPNPARRPRGDEIARVLGSARDGIGSQKLRRPHFVGRSRELELLRTAFRDVQDGQARVVHIHGESGIGKTSLMRRFADIVEARGGVVFRGACYRDASVPYKALDTIMDRIAVNLTPLRVSLDDADRAALSLMFPVFRTPQTERAELLLVEQDPILVRTRAVIAFRKLLARIAAERRGLVLCIDDMQWTDRDSIELLINLMHPPAPPGVLLVVGYRSLAHGWGAQVQAVREELPRDGDLRLGPLDAEALHALIEMTAAVDPVELESIARESAGNPFFAAELVRARSAGSARNPLSLGAALTTRVRRLPLDCQAYLELVSVAVQPIAEHVLRRALGNSPEAALQTRRVLIAESLVRLAEEEGRSVEPYHDRIREFVLDELTSERSRARHLLLAEAYEAEPTPDPEVLAAHYRAANETAKALVYTECAGDGAAHALAFDRAADLYGAAIELADAGHKARGEAYAVLYAKHAHVLSNLGRSAHAAQRFVDALEHRRGDIELMMYAGEEFLKAGQTDRGLSFFYLVADALGTPIPKSRTRAVLELLQYRPKLRGVHKRLEQSRGVSPLDKQRLALCRALIRQLFMVDQLLTALVARRYLHIALRVGSRDHIMQALSIEAAAAAMLPSWLGGGIQRAERLHQLATEIARPSDTPFARGLLLSVRGAIELGRGRWAACRAAHEHAERCYRDERSPNLRWDIAYCQSMTLHSLGLNADALELRERIQRHTLEATGYPIFETIQRICGHATLEVFNDNPVEARRIMSGAVAPWQSGPWRMQHFLAAAVAGEIDLYEGAFEGAWRRLMSTWRRSQLAGFHLLPPGFFLALSLRSRLGLALGLHREAERDIRVLRRSSAISTKEAGNALYACLLVAHGDHERAAPILERAIAPLAAEGVGLFAVAARHRLAVLANDRLGQQNALDEFSRRGIRAPEKLVRAALPLRWPGSGLTQ